MVTRVRAATWGMAVVVYWAASAGAAAAQQPVRGATDGLIAVAHIVSHDRFVDRPARTIDGCSVMRVLNVSATAVDSAVRSVLPGGDTVRIVTTCDAEGRRTGHDLLNGWKLDSLFLVPNGPFRAVATVWDGSLVYQRHYQLAPRGARFAVRSHEDSGWIIVDAFPVIEVDSSQTRPPER